MKRLILAFRCFFAVLFRKPLPTEVVAPPSPPARPAVEGAVRMLSLLQREGRLLDFLLEDISAYADAQVGAAVRDIHRGCRAAIAETFSIEPVLASAENDPVRIEDGFDAASIRLTGNVAATGPWKGLLRHHGWRATEVKVADWGALPQPAVLAPAEVELP